MPVEIASDFRLEDINGCFRVFAGPGAGKTYWLIEHIKNVVQNSERLTPFSRIACISYTNVAADEIIERLGNVIEYVEVSTIHSFLYTHVVKPYTYLLLDEDGNPLVNYAEVDGHDEHRPTYPDVKAWIDATGKRFHLSSSNQREVFAYLKRLTWVLDPTTGECTLKIIGRHKPVKYLPTSMLHLYKTGYWRKGIIDHDDVLYFAYHILNTHPAILDFLSARFPYLFVDEFQDTNPIQTQIVKWLAEAGVIVGVVGDAEQSIYGFQGASQEDFLHFSLPGIEHKDYVITGNRRSTAKIVRLLNHLRSDAVEQDTLRQIEGDCVEVLVGDQLQIVPSIQKHTDGNIYILTRRNSHVATLRSLHSPQEENLWDSFDVADSSPGRVPFIEKVAAAGELLLSGQYHLAFRMIREAYPRRIRSPFKCAGDATILVDQQRRALAMSTLELFANHGSELREQTTLEVYVRLTDTIESCIPGLSLSGYRSGSPKAFVENTRFGDLLNAVSVSDETRMIRTIHKSKGVEFQNVAVVLEDNKAIQRITQLSGDNESKRILYVALSRAIDRLFIIVPELSSDDEAILIGLGLVIRCY